ncbi:CDP-alcohol phosphatidyltransferase family protein [Mesorhizobium sp. VK23B]|uniref:CDP-alcohol phosphatidyltransferase family protein n=1 Tax=Mesorhizobium dulcispinae TaxID=3072316 RepID=A0ABU4XP87_9HYPH|nr:MULTISPECIES: CDP-alcohol phosphatidyltransferase family protein [unclassified Mesorhizobium]MDX8470159.1 CDP-alcohol phosphatidyltransferase family protein [Mesorhizobium sp. VK23B]MDX8476565.1 CDP-alcohol phosphatidyltransferase family protein [Mesorhizobium sp. VK23A]
MLIYLRDYANAITATGYLFAILGLFLTLNGRIELGTASMLWMWFLDHWDGHVARKTSDSRRPGAADFGKCLDGFGDFMHGVIFPSVVVVLVGQGSVLSLVAILALIMAGAIRLSYFESFGLTSDAKFTGIPVSYGTPLVAILLMARPALPVKTFPTVLAMAFVALAVLHVTTAIKVPAIRGRAIPIATILAVVISVVLARRGLTWCG